jgi:putative GTP pyrophosphokinase
MQISDEMRFSPVPNESKSQINKAGKVLANLTHNTDELLWAVDLTGRWRACHAYPINTLQSTLRTKLKNHGYRDYVVAQRLKRLPTIIDKLRRHPNMQLTTMQDIGGVRAILPTIKDVHDLTKEYTDNAYFSPMIVDQKDYILSPRDSDGYRSQHLVFKYKNLQNPAYDGLKIEVQIRTKLQHAWATAVETMGTFLGQALKSRQGDQKWLDFFALISSGFAYKEKCPPLPRFAHLSEMDTFKYVATMEAELGALEKMRGYQIAIESIHTDVGRGSSYYLVVLDSLNQQVTITPYDRDSIEKAMKDYSEIELEVTNGRKVEPVLVSSGSVEALKKAYPNFFLDTSEFAVVLTDILRTARKKK